MTDRVLAIDGGNSKTAVLLVDADGKVLAQVRGPGAPPQTVGMKRGLDVFEAAAVGAPSSQTSRSDQSAPRWAVSCWRTVAVGIGGAESWRAVRCSR